MKKVQYKDAILVLGAGLEKRLFRKRVELAVKLYARGIAPVIIFSGRWWGGANRQFPKTEARLMADYARKLGVKRRDIFLEEQSLNTIGNFYFTKKTILQPRRWTRLIVITHASHCPKAKYLATKILGRDYQLEWMADGTHPEIYRGHTGVKKTKVIFQKIENGDDRAIARMIRNHPYYRGEASIVAIRHTLRFRAEDRDIFAAICDGKKRVETRAATVRNRKIAAGDAVRLVCGKEKIDKKVKRVRVLRSIAALLRTYNVSEINPNLKTRQELEKMYNSFSRYREKIKRHGLIALELV